MKKNFIQYNGEKYRVRTFEVKHEHTGDQTTIYTIAPESLLDAMCKNTKCETPEFNENGHFEEHKIDNEIYHYVEGGSIHFPPRTICRKYLDIPMIFISEIK